MKKDLTINEYGKLQAKNVIRLGNSIEKNGIPLSDEQIKQAHKITSSRGGQARNKNLTPERRSEIAKMGAMARIAKTKNSVKELKNKIKNTKVLIPEISKKVLSTKVSKKVINTINRQTFDNNLSE